MLLLRNKKERKCAANTSNTTQKNNFLASILTSFFLSSCRFLLQSLEDLDSSLRKLNSRLFVIRGQPTDVFPRLFKVNQAALTFKMSSKPQLFFYSVANFCYTPRSAGVEYFSPVLRVRLGALREGTRCGDQEAGLRGRSGGDGAHLPHALRPGQVSSRHTFNIKTSDSASSVGSLTLSVLLQDHRAERGSVSAHLQEVPDPHQSHGAGGGPRGVHHGRHHGEVQHAAVRRPRRQVRGSVPGGAR